jgi:hypothetical protein
LKALSGPTVRRAKTNAIGRVSKPNPKKKILLKAFFFHNMFCFGTADKSLSGYVDSKLALQIELMVCWLTKSLAITFLPHPPKVK